MIVVTVIIGTPDDSESDQWYPEERHSVDYAAAIREFVWTLDGVRAVQAVATREEKRS